MLFVLKKFFLLLILCLSFLAVKGENLIRDTTKLNSFRVIPIAFYTPDTRWGFGAGGYFSFFPQRNWNTTRPSSVIFGLSYTQNKQLLLYAPFNIVLTKQKLWLTGELGYYKYIFNYLGIGNQIPNEYIEKYSADSPRIKLNTMYSICKFQYLGLRYAFDDFTYTKLDSTGELIQGKIVGSKNGNINSFGVVYSIDHRDWINYPTKGFLAEISYTIDNSKLGSDFDFQKWSSEASYYTSWKQKIILAANLQFVYSDGDIPFHQMPSIGGTKRLRGYFDGKYRDNGLSILQVELRFPLWKRIKWVAFAGVGKVFHTFDELNFEKLRYNSGLGLRFEMDPRSKIHLRLDYGFAKQSKGFYLTVGEAF